MADFYQYHNAAKRDVRREQTVDGDQEMELAWDLAATTGGPESKVIRGEAALSLAQPYLS